MGAGGPALRDAGLRAFVESRGPAMESMVGLLVSVVGLAVSLELTNGERVTGRLAHCGVVAGLLLEEATITPREGGEPDASRDAGAGLAAVSAGAGAATGASEALPHARLSIRWLDVRHVELPPEVSDPAAHARAYVREQVAAERASAAQRRGAGDRLHRNRGERHGRADGPMVAGQG
jgi:hypothetical protein